MKPALLFFASLFIHLVTLAQPSSFVMTLIGTPNNTKGWQISKTSFAYYHSNYFVLNNPEEYQAGYVYYDKPIIVTPQSQFTAIFEIQTLPFTDTLADGMAFWFVTKPEGFKDEYRLGIPAKPDGLVLAFDTYDNDKDKKNPLVTLWAPHGTMDYKENFKKEKKELTKTLYQQSYVADTNWHKVVVRYDKGDINVYLNGADTAAINMKYPINKTGYFGFSSGTGKLFSKHCIRNVMIASSLLPITMTVH